MRYIGGGYKAKPTRVVDPHQSLVSVGAGKKVTLLRWR